MNSIFYVLLPDGPVCRQAGLSAARQALTFS
jgi:hypothetical protein